MMAYETGWSVLPAFQGRGIATIATAQVIERLRAAGERQLPVRVPVGRERAVERDLPEARLRAGRGVTEFEYPNGSGNIMRCNDWRLELFSAD